MTGVTIPAELARRLAHTSTLQHLKAAAELRQLLAKEQEE